MAWDDAPPSAAELKATSSSAWDSAPPTPSELAKTGASSPLSFMDDTIKQQNEAAGTARDSAGNALSLNYLPQIKAKLGQIFSGEGTDNNDSYLKRRDAEIASEKAENEKYPGAHLAGAAAGYALPVVASMGAAAPVAAASDASLLTQAGRAGLAGAKGAAAGFAMGAAGNPGNTLGQIDPFQMDDRVRNAIRGAEWGGVLGAAPGVVKMAAPVVGQLLGKTANATKDFAEDAAVNATGATGAQASKFDPNAGRELLDRGLVKFGDNQSKIAQRAGAAADAANSDIDSALAKLKEKGVGVDANDIYNSIRDKISLLKKNPAQADVAANLERELDNLVTSTEARGSTNFPIDEAEQIKRDYNRKAGNWMDPTQSQSGKTMYQAMRGGVEDAATAADPSLAKQFTDSKEAYGLLAPIQEAAERRARTTQQSPIGGLLDTAASGVGYVAKGVPGAILTSAGRRIFAPRLASSAAVTADAAANGLQSASDFLLQSPRFQQMARENPLAFSSLAQNLASRSSGGQAALPAAASNSDPAKKSGPSFQYSSAPSQMPENTSTSQNKFLKGN